MPNIAALQELYSSDPNALLETINGIYHRIEREGSSPVWISLVPREKAVKRVEELMQLSDEDRHKLSLFGIPFAVKDNIDVADLATTAACRTFASQVATESASVVLKLQQAGAILIGKTNMDQFATGLVGTRTPYGICASVFNSHCISGGSSSGSAVAVASGLVSVIFTLSCWTSLCSQVTFALGTDTAGSGRVPAMFNNIIGLKPTRGRISAHGVVPACRSLDCVSIFAETASDASTILTVASGFDEQDPYSRAPPAPSKSSSGIDANHFRVGIPTSDTRQFFSDTDNPVLFQKAIDIIHKDLGGEPIEVDLTPFLAVASLLYKGPWVAERYAAVGHFIEQNEKDIDPVVYGIITKANHYTAVDLFNAVYELERLKKIINRMWEKFDVILVPTAPRSYTIDEIKASPIECNSHLGYYTNFVNLLDLAAIAVPAGMRSDGLPFGVTLIAPAFTDEAILLLGDRVHRSLAIHLGGSVRLLANTPKLSSSKALDEQSNVFLIAVVGAHLSGQPLNYQLIERKAQLVRTCRTHSGYRLYALKNSVPPKPGLLRVHGFEGPGIELEIWALPCDTVASFMNLIPSPLSIGSIFLEDGSVVKGFLVEPSALDNAQDITHTGGWRVYLKNVNSANE